MQFVKSGSVQQFALFDLIIHCDIVIKYFIEMSMIIDMIFEHNIVLHLATLTHYDRILITV